VGKYKDNPPPSLRDTSAGGGQKNPPATLSPFSKGGCHGVTGGFDLTATIII